MVFATDDFNKTFELIRRRVPYEIHMKKVILPKSKNQAEEIFLRSGIRNLSQATAFIEAFETATQTYFHMMSNKNVKNGGKWSCNHGIVNGSNKQCPASISILIKTFDKETVLQDNFLKSYPPLPAEIKIHTNHNHQIMIPFPASKMLKISNDVKVCFYEYFKRGYFGGRAKRFHEQCLRKANFYVRSDDSMNPPVRAIYTLANNWLKLKERVEIDKASDNGCFVALQAAMIKKENEIKQSTSEDLKNLIDIDAVVANIKKEPDDEYDITENNDANKIIEDPALSIKEEKIDEDESDGLPIISSYSSLVDPPPHVLLEQPAAKILTANAKCTAKTATQGVTAVVKVAQPSSPSQVIVFDPSSNTYKVVKCLSVNTDRTYSTSQYKSYLSNPLLPMRIALQKL